MNERLAAVETMTKVHTARLNKIEDLLADITKSVNRSTVILTLIVPAITAALMKLPGI